MDGGSAANEGGAVGGGAGVGGARAALREAITYWTSFIDKCISERLDDARFESFVKLVYTKYRLPPLTVADLFLRPQEQNRHSPDPRIPPYLQILGTLGYIDTPSILRALYQYSSCHTLTDNQSLTAGADGEDGANTSVEGNDSTDGGVGNPSKKNKSKTSLRWKDSYWVEEVIFYRLTKSVVQGRAVQDTKPALQVAVIVSQWMRLFTTASSAFTPDLLVEMQKLQEKIGSSKAGLVALLLRLCDNPGFVSAISKPAAKDIRRELSQALASFVPTLHEVSVDVPNRLESFRTGVLASLDPVDEKKEAVDVAMTEMLESAVGPESMAIAPIPISNTRAGLYIYLNASLVGRPLIDDAALFTYINNRYQSDVQSSATDLILASFDVLANAVFKNSSKEDAQLLRSFLVNKVPLLLLQLCPPQFSTTTAAVCLDNALNHIDTSLFPTASDMFDESRNNNPYTESVREEFCTACVLHGLVERERMERISGEMSMGYEPKKSSKEDLVQSCLSDSDKIQGLVGDLEKMDGNVGAVSHAIVELIRQFCGSKDTMSLKQLCTQLVQKPQLLDILLLFERLPAILEPLCQLLDKWKYDDDQAEYQPVYEEFGAILLLVIAFAYRYKLSTADIGLYSQTSSVRKIVSRAHVNRDTEELSEEESKHLNGWILGLFDTDAGGLGDDLMSSCPPQEFYLLIAPLFYNIVVGYANGYLTDESLKSGVEYLVDTFLLPSLVPAIRFLADYLWVDQKEQKAIIKVLQLILLPASISSEASAMLASVKKIIARPLEHALRTYQKRDPENQDINPLLNAIKDSLPQSRRIGGAEASELESWAATAPNGFSSAIRNTIQALAHWSLQPSMNIMPTSYTHKQIISGVQMMTAKHVLGIILEEVRSQSEAGSPSIIYDVAIALICAPNVSNESPALSIDVTEPGEAIPQPSVQRALTLRDALRLEAEDYKKLQKRDAAMAEVVVRLHRKVEAQLALPPPAPPLMPTAADMSLPVGVGVDVGGDLTVPTEVSLGDSFAAAMGDGPDLSGLELPSLDGLGGPSGTGDGANEDFFTLDGGLDDFNWTNDMDMT